MSTSTFELLAFSILALGVLAVTGLMLFLFARSIHKEVSEESSRYRREDYRSQRLRTALAGLATIVMIVILTAALAWVL